MFTWNKKQMKANKCSIFLEHTFKIVSLINLPKFASITKFFLKVVIFCSFFYFFSLMWLHWALSWVFQRIKMSTSNFSKKVIYGWISGLKEVKTDRECANEWYMLSLIIYFRSKQNIIMKYKKNNEKLIKLSFW